MNEAFILSKVDHTLLSIQCTETEIQQAMEEGSKYQVASVCIPPHAVSMAKKYADAYLNNKVCITTVIGFPNGYNTLKTKVYEAKEAVSLGASEIDMVINNAWVADEKWEEIINEIKAIKAVSPLLKVIIETALLTEEEKIKCCELVEKGGADFIKTSTGFHGAGAQVADIYLLRKHLASHIQIKASGGIGTFAVAEKLIEAGADRLGSSRLLSVAGGKLND